MKTPACRPCLLALLLAPALATPALAMERAASATTSSTTGTTLSPTTTDRLIVKYRSGTNTSAVASTSLSQAQVAANRQGVQLSVQRTRSEGSHVLKLSQALTLERAGTLAADLMASDSTVEYAEADRILTVQTTTPSDPGYSLQWHYQESTAGINLPTAWDLSTGSGVVVAVVDTGYRPHADLAANIVAGYDFISYTSVANDGGARDSDASDPGDWVSANECGYTHAASSSSWHGTHVAGTIAAVANNGKGGVGVAWGAKVQPVRVLGKCGGYTSDIADGIIWAAGGTVSGVSANATPAKVINLSLGGSGSCGTTFQNAINTARGKGAVVVVAAGNAAANAGAYSPASCSNVITVAAVGRDGARASYSNYGSVVDIAAPGGNMSAATANGIYSTLNTGTSSPVADSYGYYQGTSMATPHVAGVAALMLARNSALTPDQVESLIKSSARSFPATCSQCGSGIVDAHAAVLAAAAASSSSSTTTTTAVAEVESNNARSTAQSVSANPALVSGTLASTTDTDYFKLSVAAGKTLTAVLTPVSTANDDLYVYNASGALVASSRNATGKADTVTIRNSGSSTATVYARVLRVSGTYGSAGTYTLKLSQ